MDDQTRTQETLDQLADLFLTDVSPASPAAIEPLSTTTTTPPPKMDAPQPVVKASPPMRLRPETPKLNLKGPGQESRAQPASQWAIPSRLDLIWGSHPAVTTDHVSSPSPQQATGSFVEAVFLGNLPGYGGPWLTQYAHHLARQHGQVVVLRVDENLVDVELVLPRDRSARDDIEQGPQSQDRPSDLQDTLTRLATSTRVWLIHIPTPVTPQAVTLAGKFPKWTLLCGADDAAVVGAYRLIKQMVDQCTDQGQEHPQRRVGVMMMGSDEATSRSAAEKLVNTASRFLTTPIEMVGWQKRMLPVHMKPVGHFELDDDPWQVIRPVLETPTADRSSQPQGSCWDVDAEAKLRAWGGVDSVDPDSAFTEEFPKPPLTGGVRVGRPVDQAAVQTVTFGDQRTGGRRHSQLSDNAAGSAYGRTASADPRAQQRDPGLDLCAFLPEYGVPLRARCPRHRDTQLMIDPQGKCHLLRQVTNPLSGSLTGDRPVSSSVESLDLLRAAVIDLIGARSWVKEHLSLLQLTEQHLSVDEQAEPVLHLFTEHAKLAVALVKKLDGLVVIHLLQEIRIGAERTWYCVELNEPRLA